MGLATHGLNGRRTATSSPSEQCCTGFLTEGKGNHEGGDLVGARGGVMNTVYDMREGFAMCIPIV